MKFNDVDGNGTQTAGELGVAGVTVFLDSNNDGILGAGETSATTTSPLGSFNFPNLPAGTYNVREIVPAGSQPTTANPVSVDGSDSDSSSNSNSNSASDSDFDSDSSAARQHQRY
ncbi:SdrD B-like domain-containing protein [Microcoleus sp. PH2017_21_RUC_O_A]|uniref:SdrD B-like domain-containing protein n=1 Tax=Microcoleus sp. PH2017_21_RUC_O_A TaxID=2798832 RepID=UPI00345CFF26